MPYVTSIERIGLERGLKQGIQQGHRQGCEEGLQKGQSMTLARQLTKRFGPLPKEVEERLARASAAQLAQWTETILDAATLDDVFGIG